MATSICSRLALAGLWALAIRLAVSPRLTMTWFPAEGLDLTSGAVGAADLTGAGAVRGAWEGGGRGDNTEGRGTLTAAGMGEGSVVVVDVRGLGGSNSMV